MPKLRVKDINIYYEIKATGFPLIMINGLSEHVNSWDPFLINSLSKRFKLVLFDTRGSGYTSTTNKEYNMKLFADDTAGLMDKLGISKACVMGFSMGGMIAQELTLNHPEKVEKLILCSTLCKREKAPSISINKNEKIISEKKKVSYNEMIKLSLHKFFTKEFLDHNPNYINAYINRRLSAPISKEAILRYQNAISTFDTCARLSQIKSSTLIIHGKRDIVINPKNAQILANNIPNSKLVFLENSGHLLAEDREKILELLFDFLINL